MSKSVALVKFKKTGNIYYGYYNGTCGVLSPFLCTPQECYNKEYDCYEAISYCNKLNNPKNLTYKYLLTKINFYVIILIESEVI